MEKRKRETALIILSLVLVAGIGFFGARAPQKPRTPAIETVTVASEDPLYSFDAQYPAFSGLSDTRTENGLNAAVKTYVDGAMQSFRQETAGDAGSGNTTIPEDMKNSFVMRYEVELFTPDLASIRFEISTYATDATHQFDSTSAFNYDIRTGNPLGLGDMFLPDSGYLETLSAYATNALLDEFKDEQDAVGPMIQEGAGPDPENYQNIFLTKDGLLIVFDPYQVAPYAAGTIEVTVPYSEIAGAMNPNVLSLIPGK